MVVKGGCMALVDGISTALDVHFDWAVP